MANSVKKNTSKKSTSKKSIPSKVVKSTKNNPPKKESNDVFASIVTAVITLLIIIGGCYFLYTNFISVKAPNSKDYSNSFISDKDALELGEERYYWMVSHKNYDDNEYVFFKNKEVNVNNINNEDVLIMAFNALDEKDRNHNYNCKDNTCNVDSFNINILKEAVNNYFSNNLNVKYEDFRPTGNLLCSISGNQYNCKIETIHLKIDPIYTIPGFIDAKVGGNKLYVYSSYISVKRELDVYKEEDRGIYANSNLDNKIDDLKQFKKYEYDLTRENANKLVQYYKDKLQIYKSTFVLYNNSYVWEKTELVK